MTGFLRKLLYNGLRMILGTWCNGSTPRSHRGNEGSIPFVSIFARLGSGEMIWSLKSNFSFDYFSDLFELLQDERIFLLDE